MFKFKGIIKKRRAKTSLEIKNLPLIVFNALLLSLILTTPLLAGIGLMNGKFSTGLTDEYLFWLQDYDGDNNYTDRFFVSKLGNVGIGTSTPDTKLSITGESGDSINLNDSYLGGLALMPTEADHAVPKSYVDSNFISSSTLPTINNAFLQGGNAFGTTANLGTTDNQRLAFLTNNTEKMTILENGNVGIGTDSPDASLDIESSNFPVLQITRNRVTTAGGIYGASILEMKKTSGTTLNGDGIGFFFKSQNAAASSAFAGMFGGALYDVVNNKGEIVFGAAYGNVDPYQRRDLVIQAMSPTAANILVPNGNVGIGTTNPTTAKLVVDNGTGVAIDVAGGRIIGLDDPNDPGDAVSKDYVDSNFLLSDTFLDVSYWQFNSNNLFASSSDWKIGIGTSTPSAQLQINANTGIEGLRIITSDYSPLVIRDNTDANDLFRVNQEGKLKIAGSIQIGDDDEECNAGNAGKVKYNTTSTQSYICDGTRWLNQRNCGTITDFEGNTYGTVVIGGQCWMAENLKYLPAVSPSNVGSNSSPYYYVYGYQGTSVAEAKATANYQEHGVLYNWPAIMNVSNTAGAQGICPTGWHVPTDHDWNTLEKTVMQMMGGSGTCSLTYSGYQCDPAGTALKANLTGYGGTDKVGFKGILSGYRHTNGIFVGLSSGGYFWSSTPSGSNAWSRTLFSSYSSVLRYATGKGLGFSLRCLKD